MTIRWWAGRGVALATGALCVTGCGGTAVETQSRPPAAARTGDPEVRSARTTEAKTAPATGRDGFHLTQRAGLRLFSRLTRPGSYRLVAQRDGHRRRVTPVRPAATPFDVDLGTDGQGRTIAVFTRCERGGCSLRRFDPSTGGETRLAIPLSGTTGARWPSVDRGVVTFARSVAAPTFIDTRRLDGSQVASGPGSTAGLVVGLDTGGRRAAYVAVTDPTGDGVHVTPTLFLQGTDGRTRVIARGSSGEEGGTDVVSPTFAGRFLVWGETEGEPTRGFAGRLVRLDLHTGKRDELDVPGGAVFSVAADDARPGAPVLVGYDTGGPQGYDRDEARQVVRPFGVARFRPLDRRPGRR